MVAVSVDSRNGNEGWVMKRRDGIFAGLMLAAGVVLMAGEVLR